MASNMVVQTNVLALNAHRNLKTIGIKQEKASQRLSSGYRINSAADDAAGLAISEKMRAQIRGLDQASRNAQDGISLVQTAEGGMQEIDNMVQRIRELVVQASNDTNDYDTGDRTKIQEEIDQLIEEIDEMSDRVEFNAKKLLTGDYDDPTLAVTRFQNQLDAANTKLGELNLEVTKAGKAVDDLLDLAANSTLKGLVGTEKQAKLDIADNEADLKAFKDALNAIDSDLYDLVRNTYATLNSISGDFTEAEETAFWSAIDTMITTAGSTPDQGDDDLLDAIAAKYGDTPGVGSALSFTQLTALAALSTQSSAADAAATDLYDTSATAPSGSYTHLAKTQDDMKLETGYNDYIAAQKAEDDATAAVTAQQANIQAISDKLADAQAKAAAGTGQALYLQIGANSEQGIEVSIGTINSDVLGIGDGNGSAIISVDEQSGRTISQILDTLDDALSYVSSERSKLGAVQNRLEYTMNSLDISSENLSASESRIRDTDMAKEMMNLTKANVLQQAATSMLAQANQAPNSILQLLG